MLFIGLVSQRAEAQTFVASFGVQQSWGVPISVVRYVDDFYYGYEWVHTRQIVNHGVVDFQIVLQRGPVFIEITLDRFGRAYRTVRRDYYPLDNHVCGPTCGYHANYYRSHYAVCSGHNHSGQNHVVYYKRPRVNVYRNYRYNNHGANNHRHNGGSSGLSRGEGNNRGNNGVRDHGKGYGKGKGNGNGRSGGYSDNGRGKGRGSGKPSSGKSGRSNVTSSRVRTSGR